MFFEIITDEWGTQMALPTSEGDALLTGGIAVSLFLAMLFMHLSKRKVNVIKLVLCAFSIGMASVLAHVSVLSFETGGTITLFSMLAIMLPAYWFGPAAGIMTGLAYGILQVVIDPYLVTPMQVMVDYIFAFAGMGICGFFSDKKFGLAKGYIAGVLARYVFAVISGAVFFGEYAWEGWDPLPYSLAYNATYIFAEAGITFIILLLPPVNKAMEKFKNLIARDDERILGQAGAVNKEA